MRFKERKVQQYSFAEKMAVVIFCAIFANSVGKILQKYQVEVVHF